MIRNIFTAIRFPHRIFIGKYEGNRLLGVRYDKTRYLFTAISLPYWVFVEIYEGNSLFGIRYDVYLLQLGFHPVAVGSE